MIKVIKDLEEEISFLKKAIDAVKNLEEKYGTLVFSNFFSLRDLEKDNVIKPKKVHLRLESKNINVTSDFIQFCYNDKEDRNGYIAEYPSLSFLTYSKEKIKIDNIEINLEVYSAPMYKTLFWTPKNEIVFSDDKIIYFKELENFSDDIKEKVYKKMLECLIKHSNIKNELGLEFNENSLGLLRRIPSIYKNLKCML